MDGLAVNHAYEIDEDRSGFLWLSTVEGLVRYDGISFMTFNTKNVSLFQTNAVQKTEVLRDDVWLLTGDRLLFRYRKNQFEKPNLPFSHVDNIMADQHSGVLYLMEEGNLHVIQNDRIIYSKRNTALILNRITTDGALLHTPHILYHFRLRSKSMSTLDFSFLGVHQIYAYTYVADEDRYYVQDNLRRMWTYQRGVTQRLTALDDVSIPTSEDQTPEAFTYFKNGIFYQIHFGQTALLGKAPQDPNALQTKYTKFANGRIAFTGHSLVVNDQLFDTLESNISDAIIDRRGTLWVTTPTGLLQYQRAPIQIMGKSKGLQNEAVYWIHQTRSGTIYAGDLSDHGYVWDGQQFRLKQIQGANLLVVTEDEHGNVWGGSGLICPIEPQEAKPRCVAAPVNMDALNTVYRDHHGMFWLSYPDVLYQSDRLEQPWKLIRDTSGKQIGRVYRIQDGKAGDVWFGTRNAGLFRFANGQMKQVLAPNQPCGSGVRDIVPDSPTSLWLGTESNGLCYLKLNVSGAAIQVTQMGIAQGLFQNGIHRILEDQMGRFWMNTNYGIFWVFKKDLYDFVQGKIHWIPSLAYTEEHGLLNREGNGGKQDAGAVMQDGTLWFPTMGGIAIIDPRHIPSQVLSGLPAYLISVEHKGQQRSWADHQTFPSNIRDLTFSYSARSFDYPKNTLFRIQLKGYDETWRPTTTSRVVNFTNLEQGTYQLYIQAGIGGKWGAPSVFTFSIAPYWYETMLFKLFALFSIIGLAYAAIRSRTAYLSLRAKQLEETVRSRTIEIQHQQETLKDQNARLQAQTRQISEQAEQLKSLDETKSRLFINLAHEIRTPLTVITEPLSLYRKRHAPHLSEQDSRMFDTALRNGNRVLELVNQLLQIARLEAGMEQVTLTKVRLGAQLQDWVQGFFRSGADAKRVTLHLELPPQDIMVMTDEAKLHTILSNLVSNAIKYSRPESRVEIQLSLPPSGHQFQISVIDQGKGIRPADLEQIFTWYFRAPEHADTTGTGIGLSLSRELARSMGGELSVASQTGIGSVFTLVLPLEQVTSATVLPEPVQVQQPAKPDAPPSEASEDLQRPLVLIVEDNPDIAALLSDYLRADYRTLIAPNGQEGLNIAIAQPPDLVITDVMMPLVDGWTFIHTLRNIRLFKATPIIVLTARADAEGLHGSLNSGADAYIPKPFSLETIGLQVRNLLHLQREIARKIQVTFLSMPVDASPAEAGEMPDTTFIRILNHFILNHLDETELDVESLAVHLGLSRSVLFRRIKETLQQTPKQYINRIRMEQAMRLLRAEMPATQVAFAIGYQSLSGFSKAFKAHFGTSPSDV